MVAESEVRYGNATSSVAGENVLNQISEIQSRIDRLIHYIQIRNSTNTPSEAVDRVRPILHLRAQRRKFFDASLFGEPAWEMLLEAYDAKVRGRRECISSLCHSSAVPATTALRWLATLEKGGWIMRIQDPHDARRVLVEATEKTLQAMDALFGRANGIAPGSPNS